MNSKEDFASPRSFARTTKVSGKPGYTSASAGVIWSYVEVLKPRETILLTFVGVCSGIVASRGQPAAVPLLFTMVAVGFGSGACNALTNYLDRQVDARMVRTCRRPLPSQRIDPPEKMLPLAAALLVVALWLAWILHPLAFVFGLVGTTASLVWRKRALCVLQGAVAGCAPVLIGYVVLGPRLDPAAVLLCLLVIVWIPLHVWSVMIARRAEYTSAGIAYFPLTLRTGSAIALLLSLSVCLYMASIALWYFARFGWFYFAVANVLGIIMVAASAYLVISRASVDAWKIHKLSSFPYLGLIFLSMCLSFWLQGTP